MQTRTTFASDVEKDGLSRRSLLRVTTAGLAAPLLQACGGGSGASPTFPQAAPSTATTDPESVQWMREGMLAALKGGSGDLSAISAALFAGDRVVWREALGYANRESKLRATVDTRLNIGSVAKVLAALVVMILRDQGKLSLDQPVSELMPSFGMRSPKFARITVRHLISHSSGAPGFNRRNVFNFAPIPGYAQDTLEGLRQSRLKHDPGELTVYCNDGFTLVELLTLQLTGLSYPAFVQRVLFDPLGMTLTEYPLTPAAEGSFVHPVEDGRTLPQEMMAAHATGSPMSTPTDMMKLARMIMDGGVYEGRRVVSESGLRDMAIDHSALTRINPVAAGASTTRYGLGWDTVAQLGLEAAGLRAWSKNGGTAFFSTEFFVLPEARLAVLVSANGFDYDPRSLAEGLLLRTALERGTIRAMPTAIESTVPPVASSAPDVSALVGIYADYERPMQVLDAGDGSLTVRGWSASGWTVVRTGLRLRIDGRWWSDGASGDCYRFSEVLGRRYLLHRVLPPNRLYWGEVPVGEWLPQLSTPLPEAWKKRLGSRWHCINNDPESIEGKLMGRTGTIAELAERPGYVVWIDEPPVRVQLLRVIDDNEAGMTVKVPVNAGRDLVELRMVNEGGEEQLQIGTMVFRRTA
jgi:CubicO group peptidase (beta-lactamase class C family)